MPRLRAVLIDLDGTIRDSRPAINPAIEYALEMHGAKNVDSAIINVHVHSLRSLHTELVSHVPYEKFRDSYDEKLTELLSEIFVYEGAVEVLAELKQAGYKMALVSSSRFAHNAIKTDQIEHLFDAVVDGNDVVNHKPDPEPVNLALKKIGETASAAVMVGDLAADILAGKAAGVAATIGLTHGFGTREILQESGADYVLDSLHNLPKIVKELE